MSEKVYVVSEWLPKKGHEKELWLKMKELMKTTEKMESYKSDNYY